MRYKTAIWIVFACSILRGTDPPSQRLLDLSVIAVDNHGQPVTDLTIDDFQIVDAGKPQKLAFFRHRDSSLWPSASRLAPNEFSNRQGSGFPHATVILFDLMNESFGTRGYAANQIIKNLEHLEKPDNLYLYILDLQGRLLAVHGLPSAEEDIEPESVPWTKQIKPLLDGAIKMASRVRPAEIDVAARVQLTFAGLDSLGAQLSRVVGRKNVVWVTDGVPAELGPVRSDTGDFADFTPQIRELSQALERSGVALYPVRMVLIGSSDHIGASSDGAGATGGGGTGLESISTLDQFAEVTGGRPSSGKDIGAAVNQAMNDARTSYQIGYYTAANNWDGKFHKLLVTCKRKGVRIRAKTGYYAWIDAPGVETEEAIKAAVAAPFDAAEIGLIGSLSADPKNNAAEHLNARINAKDIVFGERDGHYDGELRIAVIGYTPDGRAVGSKVTPLPLHYTAEQRDEALKNGIAVSEDVALSAGFEKIRLVVFDRGSNALGSITIPVNKPTP